MRDFEDNRLEFMERMDGVFHLQMASYDCLFRAHWGREDGMDPGSLCHLKHVLGIKGLNSNMPEFNMSRRFIRTCGEAAALAAICTEMDVRRMEDLGVKLRDSPNYLDVLKAVVHQFFTSCSIRLTRESAEALAKVKPI